MTDMSDLDGLLAGAPITRTEAETGTGAIEAGSNSKSRWSSSSSAETDSDGFWHDSVCSSPLRIVPEPDEASFVIERTFVACTY